MTEAHTDIDQFFRTLRLPSQPASVAETTAEGAKATQALKAAQGRHVEAGRLLREQRLGEAPAITQVEVDRIGAEIAPLIAADQAAGDARARARAAYADLVATELDGPMAQYQQVIAERISELEDLLAVGCLLQSDANAAGIKLASRLPALCPSLLNQMRLMRQIMSRANKP